jgi:hypothetical protein
MSLKEDTLKQLRCYFEGKVCSSEKLDDVIRIRLTPEQGLLNLSSDFLELKIPVDCDDITTLRTIIWILKSFIETGHDSEFIMDFTVDDDGDLDLDWGNSSGRNWPWMMRTMTLYASTIRDIFGLPEVKAKAEAEPKPVSRLDFDNMLGYIVDDFEMCRCLLERSRERFWGIISNYESKDMSQERRRQVHDELIEAERHIEAAVEKLRG